MSAVIINLPYSSVAVPPAIAGRLGLSPEEWRLEHWRLSDPPLAGIVREAAGRAGRPGRALVVYPVSPLAADPWGLWAAELGAGGGRDLYRPGPAIPPRTSAGREINWRPKDRDFIFERTVRPFYREIEDRAREGLGDFPLVLVLTIRSFSARPWPFEKNRRFPRPQAAVSTAEGLSPPGLANLAGDCFRALRWWPELNWPQARGACLPPGLAGHPRVRALGLSLSRELYLDESSGAQKEAAGRVVRVLSTLFNLLDEELARVAGLRLDRAFKARKSPIVKAAALRKTEPGRPR
ncbi:MAG: N-formylglutamate amidohydrolase [Candidatus Adiutrix sp.]|jgi:hypothetical protein|nr:N-formylglutamate amidohydrolase [Candidatus Adiutrix sp.]